jgi:heme A synthase
MSATCRLIGRFVVWLVGIALLAATASVATIMGVPASVAFTLNGNFAMLWYWTIFLRRP